MGLYLHRAAKFTRLISEVYDVEEKLCPKCGEIKPLTEEFFYKARPRKNHPKESWQSFCKACWKLINALNKARRKDADNQVQHPRFEKIRISYVQQRSESVVCLVPQDFVQFSPEPSPTLEEEESVG